MTQTDYDLPAEWHAMGPEERDAWFKQERARRQAMNQRTAFSARLENAKERLDRRVGARAGHVSLEEMR